MGTSKKSEDEILNQDAQQEEAEEEIDFTKPLPKDFMPDDIKNMKLEGQGGCCDSDGEEEDDDNLDNPDYFDDGATSSGGSDENSSKKKLVTFMLMFPMLVTGLAMMSDVIAKFDIDKTAIQITATVGGAGIALFALAKVPQLRDAVRFVMCFAWIIFLLPTYQVYSCSPIELKNSMLGTWFKLATDRNTFLEKSYITSKCFGNHKLQAPYLLSAISVKMSLVVQINDLINLDGQKEGDSTKDDGVSYFLAVSKRSVKKKFHNLYLLLEASGQPAEMLAKSLKFNKSDKDKNLLVVTGAITNLEEELRPMKKELESMKYLVRPIKFTVSSVSYRDKYVKLKSMPDESLY